MLHDLLENVPQVGVVEWIGISSGARADIQEVEEVAVSVGTGLAGDHHSERKPGGKRQVTLIQSEHLPVIAQWTPSGKISAELLRRNIVVSGINLIALKKARFQVGDVILQGTGDCAPCSRMEENLGKGGYQAMRGHGGITAKVISSGTIRVGSEVRFIGTDQEASEKKV